MRNTFIFSEIYFPEIVSEKIFLKNIPPKQLDSHQSSPKARR
jgi:hypothetical protein